MRTFWGQKNNKKNLKAFIIATYELGEANKKEKVKMLESIENKGIKNVRNFFDENLTKKCNNINRYKISGVRKMFKSRDLFRKFHDLVL